MCMLFSINFYAFAFADFSFSPIISLCYGSGVQFPLSLSDGSLRASSSTSSLSLHGSLYIVTLQVVAARLQTIFPSLYLIILGLCSMDDLLYSPGFSFGRFYFASSMINFWEFCSIISYFFGFVYFHCSALEGFLGAALYYRDNNHNRYLNLYGSIFDYRDIYDHSVWTSLTLNYNLSHIQYQNGQSFFLSSLTLISMAFPACSIIIAEFLLSSIFFRSIADTDPEYQLG